jgi:hypothetical protein
MSANLEVFFPAGAQATMRLGALLVANAFSMAGMMVPFTTLCFEPVVTVTSYYVKTTGNTMPLSLPMNLLLTLQAAWLSIIKCESTK